MSGDEVIALVHRVYGWLEHLGISSSRFLMLAGLFAVIGILALREVTLWFLKIHSLQNEIRKANEETGRTIANLQNEIRALQELVRNTAVQPTDSERSATPAPQLPDKAFHDQPSPEPMFRLTH